MTDKKELPYRRRNRLKFHNYSEHREYYITFCTHKRKRIFSSHSVSNIAITNAKQTCLECQIDLIAYCIMPDHIHLLLMPAGEASVSEFARRYKARVTQELRKLNLSGDIWQRSFFDHVVRKDKHVNEIARYILLNPVRRGIVDHIDEYPYSGDSLDIKKANTRAE